MTLVVKDTQAAKNLLELLGKLKKLDESTVEMFVDLKNLDVHFKQTRDFTTPLADAIVTLEKTLYIWFRDLEPTFTDIEAFQLSFTDSELVGF